MVDWRIGWEGGAGDILPAAAKILWKEMGSAKEEAKDDVERMLTSGKVKVVSGGHAAS